MVKHEVARTLDGSIAREMGISRGDFLIAINNEEVRDVLDYRFKIAEEELFVEIEKPDGEIWELQIEKYQDDDLGIEFKQSLMSDTRRCVNKCVFCFIDQQPKGLRDTLYVKDDDARLSFLLGNYVTLTNMNDGEIRRLAGYHLSPLRISVHAADLDVREKMMDTSAARNLWDALQVFENAGIEMHFQIVLCKGLNDGDVLAETVRRLAKVKTAYSLAIVPAGLTRYRSGLFPLMPFERDDARAVIKQVNALKGEVELGVYLSDEWYILAQQQLPKHEEYGNFPQLDNGVGVLRLFAQEFVRVLEGARAYADQGRHIGIVTGTAAAPFMEAMAEKFRKRTGAKISVYTIKNNYFGKTVTVSGLLAGQDVAEQLPVIMKKHDKPDVVFMPENAFRRGFAGDKEKIMLDGMTLAEVCEKVGVRVKIGSVHGGKFCKQLLRIFRIV